MSKLGKIARRTFLIGATTMAGGLAVGYYFYQRDPKNPIADRLSEGEATFNPFIKIAADNTITIYTGRAEMGQGVSTTLAAYVAEELDVSLEQITVAPGPNSSAYRNTAVIEEFTIKGAFAEGIIASAERSVMGIAAETMGVQVTGGSASARDGYEKMRAAGSVAREMLKLAAARRMGVSLNSLRTENGVVSAGDRSLTYGELAAEAAANTPPRAVTLRDPKDWRLLGKSQPRTDVPAKVTGQAVFGIDVALPDMVHATVRMSPRFGASVISYDDTAARAVPGVENVVRIDTGGVHGFGVIASNTWAAFKGAEAIEVEWAAATYPATHEAIDQSLRNELNESSGYAFRSEGDAAAILAEAGAADVVEAEYAVPFLAHACLEPMNATAHIKDGKLTLWAPTQVPGLAVLAASAATGINRDAIELHTTFLGGGFGRRTESDFVRYAAILALHTDGRPVKVTWSREEDTRHDTYRPAARARMKAVVQQGQLPTALHAKVAAPSVIQSLVGRSLVAPPVPTPDRSVVEGMFDQPIDLDHISVSGVHAGQTLPIGFWRSVGHSHNGFFHETFLDEIAHHAGLDPVEMRLRLMANHPTAQKCMEKVAKMSGWGRPLPAGQGMGVAFTFSYGSWVAQVAKVSVDDDGVRIDNIWCAADVGRAMDPAIVAAQMQSGIIFGLSSAMNQKITLADGEVQEGNFWEFDSMRMAQCPRIEVAVLENAPKMGGAGEPGMPPSVPALGNAIFAATGQRLRSLPFGDEVTFV
ncbi:MAG: molybdopterin cofactor-binding domain-containing protein [Pikeienuella sp.]